jgi:hypothetical protein
VEPSIDHDYWELEVDKWPVYFTEAYYSSDSGGPQESDSSARHSKFPSSYLPVIKDVRILEHLNHGAALNTPYLSKAFDRQTCFPPLLSLNVPKEEARGVFIAQEFRYIQVHTSNSHSSNTYKPDVLHSFQRLVLKWLLVCCSPF